jgi:hypothetical protein
MRRGSSFAACLLGGKKPQRSEARSSPTPEAEKTRDFLKVFSLQGMRPKTCTELVEVKKNTLLLWVFYYKGCTKII